MKVSRLLLILFILSTMVLLLSCAGSSRKVSRMPTDSVTDLSGRWNDTDSRLTAEAMIQDLLSRSWLDEYQAAAGQKPIMIVGQVRNKSSEHINTDVFTKDIERELINSGKVTFVATSGEREQLRDERLDQQYFSSPETMKAWANETGADHMLLGSINSIVDSVEGQKVVYYQVNLELINIEKNTKVWIGEKKIKKLIEQDKYSW
ncbi:MAG: penicillin-binding protein activator LpoB [Caldithrix sp. RBG_13_44_9]|nr:MAG: penicillin-binding protein activator LpoB [Caldithrix sp. RBG_13_44_9]